MRAQNQAISTPLAMSLGHTLHSRSLGSRLFTQQRGLMRGKEARGVQQKLDVS